MLAWIAGGAIAWVTVGAVVAMIVGGVIARCEAQVRRPVREPVAGAVRLPTQRTGSMSPRCGCRAVVGRGVTGGRA